MLLKNIIALLFPEVCPCCENLLSANEAVICSFCRHELPLTQHHLNPENEAFKKFYGKIELQFVSTMLYFHKKGLVQKLIHSLKYKDNQNIGTVLGRWYAADLKDIPTLQSIDAIVAVPLHPKKLKLRGYNQNTTFCKALATALHLDFEEKLLIRTNFSKTQSQKNFVERTRDLNESFQVLFNQNHVGKHYLLVDDVLTTGTTLEACCRALLQIPQVKISIVCMAMSHS